MVHFLGGDRKGEITHRREFHQNQATSLYQTVDISPEPPVVVHHTCSQDGTSFPSPSNDSCKWQVQPETMCMNHINFLSLALLSPYPNPSIPPQ
jgi:hypothetical protein